VIVFNSFANFACLRLPVPPARQGPEGILHGNKGRRPSHSFSIEEKERVVELAKERYFDFNFSHLSEILEEEEGIKINRETLRQWFRPLGFGGKVRKQPHHRKRRKHSGRERKLLFLDGCLHVCIEMCRIYDLPAGFYLDRASQFTTTRHGASTMPKTQLSTSIKPLYQDIAGASVLNRKIRYLHGDLLHMKQIFSISCANAFREP